MGPAELEVRGGAGGVEAELADLEMLGRSGTSLAELLATTSLACHRVPADPDLLASAVLDPAGVARFDAALLEALDGPRGLSALAVTFTARAVTLRGAATAYEAADAALARTADDLQWAAGYFPVHTAAALLAIGAGRFLVDPEGAAAGVGALLEDPERWLTQHPGAVDLLVDAAPGFGERINSLTGGRTSPWLGGRDVRAAARRLGRLWADGEPFLVPTAEGEDVALDMREEATRAPRGVEDLLEALELRSRESDRDHDRIAVRIITRADGTRAYVVDIPGTKEATLPGGRPNPNPNDLATNFRVLGGDVATRQQAVAMALEHAGAGPSDPVMLVGHSQGGMVAAQAAHDSGTAGFPFDVRSVVTAGSPVARAGVPPGVQVLALENAHDVVPHLDGRTNDDDAHVTTVTFEQQNGSIAENHRLATAYRSGAQAVDRSADPSIAAFRRRSGAFFVGPGETATVQARVYEIGRR